MTLLELKEYFKTNFSWNESISIGKTDNNQEKAICFYNSNRNQPYSPMIGCNKSTKIIPITILLRYTKNKNTADLMAKSIYEFFERRTFLIGNKRVFTMMIYDDPIDLGTDDKGVYEYSFEIDFYNER
jgi:hypothetical protein